MSDLRPDRENAILQAARDLLTEVGYDRMSVDRILLPVLAGTGSR